MTKQNLITSPVNLITLDSYTSSELHIDAMSLVKRTNALIKYSSDLKSDTGAEKHAREISIHIKTLKDILDHNKAIAEAQTSTEQEYTPEEEYILAEELAAIMRNVRGHS